MRLTPHSRAGPPGADPIIPSFVGTCWRQLPLEEKRVWEVRAKHEKAAHKAQFPDYRFRPVHNKNKHLARGANNASAAANADDSRRREKAPTTLEDERRCDEVAQLLLEGKKGEELALAVRNLDRARERELASLAASGPPSPGGAASPRPAQHPHLHMPLPVPGMSPGFFNSQQNMYPRRPVVRPAPQRVLVRRRHRGTDTALPPKWRGVTRCEHLEAGTTCVLRGCGSYNNNSSSSRTRSNSSSTTTCTAPMRSPTPTAPSGSRTHSVAPLRARRLPLAPRHRPRRPPPTGTRLTHRHSLPASHRASGTPPSPSATPSAWVSDVGRAAHSHSSCVRGERTAARTTSSRIRSPRITRCSRMRSARRSVWEEGGNGVQAERDHSPLPDVEPELFAPDFSFGGSSSSSSTSGASSVPPGGMDGGVSPVSPVPIPPAVGPSEASISVYEGSPLAPSHALGHSHHGSMDGVYTSGEGGMYGGRCIMMFTSSTTTRSTSIISTLILSTSTLILSTSTRTANISISTSTPLHRDTRRGCGLDRPTRCLVVGRRWGWGWSSITSRSAGSWGWAWTGWGTMMLRIEVRLSSDPVSASFVVCRHPGLVVCPVWPLSSARCLSSSLLSFASYPPFPTAVRVHIYFFIIPYTVHHHLSLALPRRFLTVALVTYTPAPRPLPFPSYPMSVLPHPSFQRRPSKIASSV